MIQLVPGSECCVSFRCAISARSTAAHRIRTVSTERELRVMSWHLQRCSQGASPNDSGEEEEW